MCLFMNEHLVVVLFKTDGAETDTHSQRQINRDRETDTETKRQRLSDTAKDKDRDRQTERLDRHARRQTDRQRLVKRDRWR